MKNTIHRAPFVSAAIMLLFFLACQTNTPNSAIPNTENLSSNNQLRFLSAQKGVLAKKMVNEQFISADEGGMILVGDEETGYSSIQFMPGDLSEDVLITFGWDNRGHIAELSPHGLVFNNPVALNLSYGNADLSEMSEGDIQIWYFNETEKAWELVGGEVNQAEKHVEGFIRHFSKYALAGGGD